MLLRARQALLSHPRNLGHAHRQQLVEHIEGSGARIMGFLPQDTLVVVGSAESLHRAANHSLVLWAGPHEAAHKVAPEWQPLLEQLDVVTGSLGRGENRVGTVDGRNETKDAQMLLAAAVAQLPVRIQHRPGRWPQVGIRVTFPVMHLPKPHAPDHEHATRHALRIQRVIREEEARHAGVAAAADWGPLLRSAFGGDVEVHPASPDSAVVFAPPEAVEGVVAWLASRPAVQWVAPLPRSFVRNRQASVITQSGKPAPNSGSVDLDPSLHPVWAAGITGKNQVMGQGDSGIDYNHCFFVDPTVDWNSAIVNVAGVRTFESTTHRKIRLYRAFADFSDANGHGTHTAGTLAGIPYGTTLADDDQVYVGMAPDAKLAFIGERWAAGNAPFCNYMLTRYMHLNATSHSALPCADLSSASDGDSILTPYDLMNDYFKYTSDVGAGVHSDSWGSTSVVYDTEASQVDAYCWQNPYFLPVFPAGNDGDVGADGGEHIAF